MLFDPFKLRGSDIIENQCAGLTDKNRSDARSGYVAEWREIPGVQVDGVNEAGDEYSCGDEVKQLLTSDIQKLTHQR